MVPARIRTMFSPWVACWLALLACAVGWTVLRLLQLDGQMQISVVGTAAQAQVLHQWHLVAAWGFAATLLAVLGLGAAVARRVIAGHRAELKLQEASLQRMGRFYQALSRTNQLIVREHHERRLLDEICSICVDSGHARMACIYLVDAGGTHALRTATAGPAAEFMDGIPLRWDMTTPEAQKSITVQAMRDNVHVISNDYQHDPRAVPWRERAIKHGIFAMALLPLRRRGRAIGALLLCGDAVGFFDEPLVELLDEMTADVSFALDNLDRETERVEALRAAEAGLERFSRLFHGSPVATAIMSLQTGQVRDLNDIACEFYHRTREQVIGRSFQELGLGLSAADRDSFFQQLRQHGRVKAYPVKLNARPGEARDALITGEIIDHLGETCVLAMGVDISELRQAEQARQALAQAEAANRAKSEFLSQMSHELRTPLNAVLGFSQLLLADARERLTPAQVGQLEHIRRAGWHLLALVNDVLDVSRIESGQLSVQAQAVDLQPIVDEALHMAEPLAQPLAVQLQGPARGPAALWVMADPMRLRQVLVNLLSNAIKYNRPGGTARVAISRRDAQVQIEVTDSGIGMTREQLAHLYEPFNRLGRERGGVEGTGIGLALTRQLVRLMQGQMEVDSEPGRGTRVRITLPACEVQEGQAPSSFLPSSFMPSLPMPLEPAGNGKGNDTDGSSDPGPTGVVLYIEDNPVNLLLVEQLLARWSGVRLVQAEDGASGLELARSLRPDLVLLDMQLPDMDGTEVLQRLHTDPQTSALAVVALSANAMPEAVAQARQLGASDYWTKPLDFDRFLTGVQRLLGSVVRGASAGP